MDCPTHNQAVLIVDDDEGIRDSIEAVLEIGGIQCFKARDAEDATKVLSKETPGLILLDCHLPGASGEEFTTRLRQEGDSILIVGMSAEDRSRTMIAAGATTFLDKPFNPNELISLVKSLLSSQALVM